MSNALSIRALLGSTVLIMAVLATISGSAVCQVGIIGHRDISPFPIGTAEAAVVNLPSGAFPIGFPDPGSSFILTQQTASFTVMSGANFEAGGIAVDQITGTIWVVTNEQTTGGLTQFVISNEANPEYPFTPITPGVFKSIPGSGGADAVGLTIDSSAQLLYVLDELGIVWAYDISSGIPVFNTTNTFTFTIPSAGGSLPPYVPSGIALDVRTGNFWVCYTGGISIGTSQHLVQEIDPLGIAIAGHTFLGSNTPNVGIAINASAQTDTITCFLQNFVEDFRVSVVSVDGVVRNVPLNTAQANPGQAIPFNPGFFTGRSPFGLAFSADLQDLGGQAFVNSPGLFLNRPFVNTIPGDPFMIINNIGVGEVAVLALDFCPLIPGIPNGGSGVLFLDPSTFTVLPLSPFLLSGSPGLTDVVPFVGAPASLSGLQLTLQAAVTSPGIRFSRAVSITLTDF